MKKALLLVALIFVVIMLSVQVTYVLLDTFNPEALKSVSNVIEGVYEKIG
jgi:hypothetical protein